MTKQTAAIAAWVLLLTAPLGARTGLCVGAHATGASRIKLNVDAPVVPLDFGSAQGTAPACVTRFAIGASNFLFGKR